MTRISEDAAEIILRETISDAAEGKKPRTAQQIIEEKNLGKPSKQAHFKIAEEVVSENQDKIKQVFIEGKVDEILGHLIGQAKKKNRAIDAKEMRENLSYHLFNQFRVKILEESWKNEDIEIDWKSGEVHFTMEVIEQALTV